MSLNLNGVYDTNCKSLSNEELISLEMDLLTCENELNNYCNALEIAEKAQETQSVEVMQFAESLLGVSVEELVKGLGYKKDYTKQQIAGSAFAKIRAAKEAFKQLATEFKALKAKAGNEQATFVMPNMGTKMTAFLAKRGFEIGEYNGRSKQVSARKVCSVSIKLCAGIIALIEQAEQAYTQNGEKQTAQAKKHDMWRGYQFTVSLGRRILSVMRTNRDRVKAAINK